MVEIESRAWPKSIFTNYPQELEFVERERGWALHRSVLGAMTWQLVDRKGMSNGHGCTEARFPPWERELGRQPPRALVRLPARGAQHRNRRRVLHAVPSASSSEGR